MAQSQVVLIGGGTGFVGKHLVNLLRNGGAKVRIITRRPGSSDQISWEAIRSNGLPGDTTAVINLAGRNVLEPGPCTEKYKKEVFSSRTETNQLLASAINAATNKPRSFVTASGVGYYPMCEADSETEYDEEWQPQDGDRHQRIFMAKLVRDWEESSKLDEATSSKTRRVAIRAGAVIGPDGGIIKGMMLPFKLGLGGPIGDGQQWLPWIHVDDLASMFKFSILNDHVEGVINGVAPEQVKNKQFTDIFAKSLARPSFLPVPKFAVRLMLGPERSPILLNGKRIKSRAGLLGFRYQYPTLESAINACLKSQ